MADKEEEEEVKNEGSNPEGHGDDHVPISAIDKGKGKMVAYDEGHRDDNVPISAIDKGKGKMVAYDDDDDDSDEEEPLLARAARKFSGIKIGEKRKNVMPSKAYKKEPEGLKEDMKKKVQKGDNKKENSKGKDKQDPKSSSCKAKNVKMKKVYDLPGQKHNPPEERDPLRTFYESLHRQRPDSEMAAVWMMERGLLPEDEAKEVFEKKKKKGSSPAKSTPARKSPAKKSPARSSVKRSLDRSGTKKGPGASKDNSAKDQKDKAEGDSEEDDYDQTGPSNVDAKKKQKVSN